jgi:hypothetical protein
MESRPQLVHIAFKNIKNEEKMNEEWLNVKNTIAIASAEMLGTKKKYRLK